MQLTTYRLLPSRATILFLLGWTYTAADKKQSKLPCSRPKTGRNLITSKTSGRFSIHGVPYSEHSSFPVSEVQSTGAWNCCAMISFVLF